MKKIAIFGIQLLFLCVFSITGVLACTTSAWSPGASGNVAPNDPANGVPKVSGACGLKVNGTGYVQDNSPSAEDQFIARFYFMPQFSGEGSTDIFVAYSDEASTELFTVEYDGSNIVINATAAAGSASTTIPAGNNRWHLIEFLWTSGGTGGLWVNADATKEPANATFSSGTGVVESVRLGAPNGLGGLTGMIFFDDYESHRSTPVGGLLAGDSNRDGIYDSADVTAIVEEFLYGAYAEGVNDCNLDGGINSGDVNCVVALF